jgi:hypothetical protein
MKHLSAPRTAMLPGSRQGGGRIGYLHLFHRAETIAAGLT